MPIHPSLYDIWALIIQLCKQLNMLIFIRIYSITLFLIAIFYTISITSILLLFNYYAQI